MSVRDASLRNTWDSLRARKQVQDDFLNEVRLKGLRGIRNLRAFDYPVSAIAGSNGCGKSTVLFARAAAYAPAGGSAVAEHCAERPQTGNRGGPRRDGRVQRQAHGEDRRPAAGRRPLMAGYPRIPYGVANFRGICVERRLYVDKTRCLHALEQVDHAVVIRTRRFGKTCWVSLLEHYYDRTWAREFDTGFGCTDVGRWPTEHRHRYVVLRFNFSGFKTALDGLEHHFEKYRQLRLRNALERNPDLFPEPAVRRIRAPGSVNGQLNELFAFAERGIPLYALIDEYDNFANTVLAHQGDAAYQRFTHGSGFYRNFFAALKAGTEAEGDGPEHVQGQA